MTTVKKLHYIKEQIYIYNHSYAKPNWKIMTFNDDTFNNIISHHPVDCRCVTKNLSLMLMKSTEFTHIHLIKVHRSAQTHERGRCCDSMGVSLTVRRVHFTVSSQPDKHSQTLSHRRSWFCFLRYFFYNFVSAEAVSEWFCSRRAF